MFRLSYNQNINKWLARKLVWLYARVGPTNSEIKTHEWATISHGSIVFFLKLYQRQARAQKNHFRTTVCGVIKIMSAHAVDKYWMRAVDEKQVISL